MKKYSCLLVTLIMLIAVIAACGTQKSRPQTLSASNTTLNTGAGSTADNSQASSNYCGTKDENLISVLKAAKPKNSSVVYFYSGDFEGNKQPEAFAFVGTYANSSIDADLWFVTTNSAKVIYKSYKSVTFKPYIWTVGNIKMLRAESSAGGSSSQSLAWLVKNGNPVECGIGMNMSYLCDGKNFVAAGDTFDMSTSVSFNSNGSSNSLSCGHTYKIYYFYWDGVAFKEYGGIKITLRQLASVSGAKQVIDQIQRGGYQIGDIFYRANNIININYYKISNIAAVRAHKDYDISYDNATLLYQNNAAKLVNINGGFASTLEQSDYRGIYKTAFNTNIASYPGKFSVK